MSPDTLIPNNPYVGPRSIKTGEAFFGRDREIRSLSALLVSERIVLLHSPSGAGKSSLIQAGLIPNMTERFTVFPLIRVNLELPEEIRQIEGINRYVISTLISLEENLPRKERTPFKELATLSLNTYLDKRGKPENDSETNPENILLIFDQFEEVLSLSPTDAAIKQGFFEQLGEALQNRRRWALFAIREDYMGGLAPYVRAIPNRLSVAFRLGLLGPEAARLAIQQPARNKNVDFTDAAAQKLVDDLRKIQVQLPDGSFVPDEGPNVEPVQLQVVCYNLWQARAADDQLIDEDDLQRVGNVDQALARYYANAIQSVAENKEINERILRQWFDKNLITAEGIRSQVLKGSKTTEGMSNATLRLLENTHLIRGESRAGKTWYELSHDRLVQPVRKDNTEWFERNLSVLQRQAVLWNKKGRSEGLLLRGEALAEAEKDIDLTNLPADELDFLTACQKLRDRERRDILQKRIMLAGLLASLVFLAMAIMGFVYANQQAIDAQASEDKARAEASNALDAKSQAEAAKATSEQNARIAATAQAREALNANAASTAEAIAIENANAASTARAEAVISANLAATAQANAENALKRVEAVVVYRAQALVAFSIEKTRSDPPGAFLLAVEAFKLLDNYQTRSRLMGLVELESTQLVNEAAGKLSQAGTYAITFSPDGRLLASVHTNGLLGLWNAQNRQLIDIQYNGSGKGIYAVAFSPNGNLLVTGDFENNVIWWDVNTFSPIRTQTGHTDWVYSVAFSPDGSMLASGGADRKIILWNAETGEKVAEFPEQNDKVFSLVFSPDGRFLASGARGGDIIIWDVLTQTQVGRTLSENRSNANYLAFSPDGKILASGHENASVVLWDIGTMRKIGSSLKAQTQRVSGLAFNPDGKTLASASYDGTVVIWDVASGLQLDILSTGSTNYSVSFSPDGNILASGGIDDSSARIFFWDFNPLNWIKTACERAGRNLTQDEWDQYFPGEPYRPTCPE